MPCPGYVTPWTTDSCSMPSSEFAGCGFRVWGVSVDLCGSVVHVTQGLAVVDTWYMLHEMDFNRQSTRVYVDCILTPCAAGAAVAAALPQVCHLVRVHAAAAGDIRLRTLLCHTPLQVWKVVLDLGSTVLWSVCSPSTCKVCTSPADIVFFLLSELLLPVPTTVHTCHDCCAPLPLLLLCVQVPPPHQQCLPCQL